MKKISIVLIFMLASITSICQNSEENNMARDFRMDVSIGSTFVEDDNNFYASLNLQYGAVLTPSIFLGAGIGAAYYDYYYASFSFPIYANLRYEKSMNRWSPLVDAKVGYSFGKKVSKDFVNEMNEYVFSRERKISGLFFEGMIGARHKNNYEIGIAYTLQNALYREHDRFEAINIEMRTWKELLNTVAFRIGYHF